jgi:hypothetical protein
MLPSTEGKADPVRAIRGVVGGRHNGSGSAMQNRNLDCLMIGEWPGFGAIWSAESLFGLSVWLADRVVPCHTFNLFGFGPVNSQARHSKKSR